MMPCHIRHGVHYPSCQIISDPQGAGVGTCRTNVHSSAPLEFRFQDAPLQERAVCQALSGVRPHATRRCRNTITSAGSRSVYLASVGLACNPTTQTGLGYDSANHTKSLVTHVLHVGKSA